MFTKLLGHILPSHGKALTDSFAAHVLTEVLPEVLKWGEMGQENSYTYIYIHITYTYIHIYIYTYYIHIHIYIITYNYMLCVHDFRYSI